MTWPSGSIPTSGSGTLGWATHGSQKPANPGSSSSTVSAHTAVGQHGINFSAAQSSQYQQYLTTLQNAPMITPPATTTSSQAPQPSGPISCPGAPQPSYALNAAQGFRVTTLLGRLTTPRGIALDSRGQLLVVERGRGISAHVLDSNGCVTSSRLLISDTTLNHGIDVVGNKLYARCAVSFGTEQRSSADVHP